MPVVEAARVVTIQITHPLGEVRSSDLDDEVVVVPHQAGCVDAPAVAAADTIENPDKEAAVVAVDVDRPAVVPARCDVVEAAGDDVAKGTSHTADASSPQRTNT